MNSIPASQLVNVQPGVLGAGGNPLSLNGVFLDNVGGAIPIGTVAGFADTADVVNFYGAGSPQAIAAGIYFNGFTGRNTVPGQVFFVQYNTAPVAGYLRGDSLSGVPLTAIQALSGTITLSIDGVSNVSAAINLAGATSFSNAAALITAGILAGAPGSTAQCTYDSQRAAFVITSSTTGASSAVGFPAVDSLTTGLQLTAATGAVLSPGAIAAVPATLMNSVVSLTQNWFTFTPVTEPAIGVKEAFEAWVQTQNDTYKYVQSDSDVTALAPNASASFGAIVKANASDGVVVIYDPTGIQLAAFNMGTTASIDPNEVNGRITFAYKNQAGLAASVFDATSAQNLIANGYNFYGAYATANQPFTFYQPGQIAGQWVWDDAYTNQRIINAALQLALVELLANTKAVPYNQIGYNLIRSACLAPINAALSFGSIQPGVSLSAAQAAEVNQAAGAKIDTTLSTVGWYLQILDPGAIVRGGRGSPKCTFWYTDGGSVQTINLASIDVL